MRSALPAVQTSAGLYEGFPYSLRAPTTLFTLKIHRKRTSVSSFEQITDIGLPSLVLINASSTGQCEQTLIKEQDGLLLAQLLLRRD